MNKVQAELVREARDGYTQRVSRATKAALAAMYRDDLAECGIVSLFGGPSTKQEFISALVELHYPLTQQNEAIHVLYHTGGIVNEVCPWCDPHPCPECGAIDRCDYTAGGGAVVNGRHAAADRLATEGRIFRHDDRLED